MSQQLLLKVLDRARNLQREYDLRPGQAAWAALDELESGIAGYLEFAPESDPFYEDENLSRFYEWVLEQEEDRQPE